MCVSVVCQEYNIIFIFWFHVYIFVDFVKDSVLTLVSEIPHHQNDHYYFYNVFFYMLFLQLEHIDRAL